ncbi:hypothetical protein F8M41_023234 [Gigaspora margarita]|uniref:Uncharacterized protein n=1 Tax=Gigaspora margarita TaxID=4874 RepID=A0A8H4ADQ9_GIGMA|nr:hypothetical protein F8M41_023234 [Gigaspora margarita]
MSQEIQFERIEGETSQELGKRFEEFCAMLLKEFEKYGIVIDHVRKSGDLEDRCSVQSVVFKRNRHGRWWC